MLIGAIAVVVMSVLSGCVFVTIGVFTCLKRLWAVYVGLDLCYLSLLVQVRKFDLCPVVIRVIVLMQAHWVIRWGHRLRDRST